MGSNDSLGTDFDKRENKKVKWLLEAARTGATEALKPLLDQKVPVDAVDPDDPLQNTALHLAAENGKTEAVRLLLKYGADPNKRRADENGRSPLHLAAGKGYPEVIEVLLANGANLNQTGNMGMTALYRAITLGQLEAAQTLIFHGADVHIPDLFGVTALENAALSKKSALVKLLKIYISIEPYLDQELLSASAKKVATAFSAKPQRNKAALEECISQLTSTVVPKILENKQSDIEHALKKSGINAQDLTAYFNNAKEIFAKCLTTRLYCNLFEHIDESAQNNWKII